MGKDKKKESMFFSHDGVEILKRLEEFRAKPYRDSNGKSAIGYGHTIKKGEMFLTINEHQALSLLMKDVESIEQFLNKNIHIIVTQNQYDALVMFIYNIGEGAFKKSDVFRLLKERKYEEALEHWAKWIHVKEVKECERTGEYTVYIKEIPGLMHRRLVEIDLFTT